MPGNKRYLLYTVEDFLADADFQDWVFRPDEAAEAHWQTVVAELPDKKEPVEKARKVLESVSFKQDWPDEERVEAALNAALQKIKQEEPAAKVVWMRPLHRWLSVAVAVALLIGGYFFWQQKWGEPEQHVAQKPVSPAQILPGGDKATLTLADGTQIILDSAANGNLSQQGGTKVVKMGGQLAYNAESNTAQVLYNTIVTPKGGQYQLLLADGTKVWLNAASSLRFPTAFVDKERAVALTGEGYFEVAHNASMPFRVKVAGMDVQVLGTHFNINSYSDEEEVKTTLLEGKVTVKKESAVAVLAPGQQALVDNNGLINVDKNADVEAAVAWKNGLFQFRGADIKTIARQIERWYDVDVRFAGNFQFVHLSGEAPRTLNLSQVMAVLEASGIDVKTSGRTLTVTPKP